MSALAFRTPEQYLQHAKKLRAKGDPRAHRAMQAAAFAYATADAAKAGRMDLARQGLAGLRAMSGGLADPAPTLSREQIQSKFAALAQRQATANMATLRTAGAVVSLVMVPLQAAGNAISDTKDRALYSTVLQVINFAIASATGGMATMPVLSADAIAGIGSFCTTWNGLVRGIATQGISALATTTALRDRSAASAIQTIGNVVVGVADGLCNDPQIVAAMTPPPAGAGNCPTLTCTAGPNGAAVPNADGTGCECRYTTAPNPLRDAETAWRRAIATRVFSEVAMVNPSPSTTLAQNVKRNALDRNCASACTLEHAEREYLAALVTAGRDPILPALGTAAPSSRAPRKYINAATRPANCQCSAGFAVSGGSDSGGGGATLLVGAAAAAGALWYFLR